MKSLLTCLKCGWVHFPVTREHALEQIRLFNEYFYTLSEERREQFYGNRPSSIELYDRCFRCAQTDLKAFRKAKDGDCPMGCTIQPIIDEITGGE